jgi:hypothetical protein
MKWKLSSIILALFLIWLLPTKAFSQDELIHYDFSEQWIRSWDTRTFVVDDKNIEDIDGGKSAFVVLIRCAGILCNERDPENHKPRIKAEVPAKNYYELQIGMYYYTDELIRLGVMVPAEIEDETFYEIKDEPVYFVQDKRHEVRKGNSVFILVFVKRSPDTSIEDVALPRIRKEVSSSIYDDVVKGLYYRKKTLEMLGLKLEVR